MSNSNQDRRRQTLVEPKYQILFAILLVLLQLNVVVLFQGLMQHKVRQVADQAGSLEAFLSTNLWTATLGPMLIVAAGTSTVLLLLGIWFSNRIVGPLPRLQRTFQAMAKGDYSVRVKFRPGDALENMAVDVNQLAEALERRHGNAHQKTASSESKNREPELSAPVA